MRQTRKIFLALIGIVAAFLFIGTVSASAARCMPTSSGARSCGYTTHTSSLQSFATLR